jgi:RNA polymerase sigma-70 factor (ECF subfamily)
MSNDDPKPRSPDAAASGAPGDRDERSRRERRWSVWMASAQSGDAEAYHRLLEDILPGVRRQVGARLGDPEAREDVVQNALLSIHRARHTYRPERPFGPWMRTIVRNAVVDSLRERGRRIAREAPLEHPESVAAPPEAGRSAELSPRLQRALRDLPDKQRQAVELIQVEGLSVAEAALRANVTPGALKVRAHRGYRALRERLARSRE